MIPVAQTKLTSTDGTARGNCMAACVASLLEVPISSVPAWEDMGSDGSWGDSFMSFLEQHGYEYHGLLIPDAQLLDDWWSYILERSAGIDGCFIIGGKSPRTHVTRGHAVIYKDGKLAHDPHPSGAGITEIEEIYIIERKES